MSSLLSHIQSLYEDLARLQVSSFSVMHDLVLKSNKREVRSNCGVALVETLGFLLHLSDRLGFGRTMQSLGTSIVLAPADVNGLFGSIMFCKMSSIHPSRFFFVLTINLNRDLPFYTSSVYSVVKAW